LNYKYSVITSVKIINSLCPKSDLIEVEGRSFYSISYRYSGAISIVANGNTYISKQDYVTIIPKGMAYETEVLEDSNIIAIHFELSKDIQLEKIYTFCAKYSVIKNLFGFLSKKHNKNLETNFECLSIIYEILAELENFFLLGPEGNLPSKMFGAQKFILTHYPNPNLSVVDIASHLNISDSYLRRNFKKYFNCSPSAYLNEVRIKNAKNILLSTECSINETAVKCGFNSASYFIQNFHKMTGKSPTEYRRKKLIE
jgi:AraC-like DNA-binding protein